MDDQFETPEITQGFDFLNYLDVRAHFADLNIALLGGRHIQTGEGHHYALVNNYTDQFRYFYRSLYNLELKKARFEHTDYYYLDFRDEGKGKLNSTDRFREMTPWEMLIALMLLNMYYERFFDQAKIISWAALQKEIMESELSNLYKRAFFNNQIRDNYSDPEWKNLNDTFKRVLRNFDRWGWIKLHAPEEKEGELIFSIRESIDRFGKLYQYEISHFEDFIAQINQRRGKA